MKYINLTIDGISGLVLFPDYLCHADVAGGRTAHSAGFVDLQAMTCYGESTSLGLRAMPRDTDQLRAMLGIDAVLLSLLHRQAS